jgi:signal transduction histidine kinase
MTVIDQLEQIRPAWLEKTSHRLARGEGVRERFVDQLIRFFDLLKESIDTGDSTWLDPVIHDWVYSQTGPEEGVSTVDLLPILTQILLQTQEICAELLPADQANLVMGSVLPHFTYAYERIAELEMGIMASKMRNELESTQVKLERLDKTKSNFISVAAHELKTPLTLLEGYTMMLREMYPAEDQDSQAIILLKGMDNGTRRLKEIVDDMIDVSLIDSKLMSLNFQPVWMNRLIAILVEDLMPATNERDQKLEVIHFPGIEEVNFGDPERLYQAFRNLLTNAIKFTPDGGQITISGRMLPGFIEVTIQDTGIGIDTDDQSVIFEKFGRLGDVQQHSSGKTKFKGGGPGLGLPIARGIIEVHGGTIWVESDGYDEETHPGSTFHVLLPLRNSPPDHGDAMVFAGLRAQHNLVSNNPSA